jgi:hypothetical protein
MKKIFLLLCLSAGVAITSFAQAPQAAQDPSYQSTQTNTPASSARKNKLNLTPDQQSRMKQIKDNEKAQEATVKNNNSLTADQKAAQIKTLKKQSKVQKNGLLTADQRAQAKQMKADRKASGKTHGKHKSDPANSTSSDSQTK